MKRILVSDYGVFIGRKGDRILIKKKGEKVGEIAVGNVSQIILASRGITLSTDLLRLLLKYKIDLVILSGYGTPLGRLISRRRKGGVKLRKNQYEAQKDWRGAHLAKQFAKAKISNQRYLLRSMAKSRKDSNPELSSFLMKTYRELISYVMGIDGLSGSNASDVRQSILNLEGKAADKYWDAVKMVFSGIIDFPGRKKRFDKPNDPLNVMLNFGYGLLYSEVWLNIEYTSLDPYAGFLHTDSPRRPALVMDLIEEFRQPIVDRAVFKIAFNLKEKILDLVSGRLLTNEGRRMVSSEISSRLRKKVTFQDRSLPIGYHISLQARRLAELIMGRCNEYTPFILK